MLFKQVRCSYCKGASRVRGVGGMLGKCDFCLDGFVYQSIENGATYPSQEQIQTDIPAAPANSPEAFTERTRTGRKITHVKSSK